MRTHAKRLVVAAFLIALAGMLIIGCSGKKGEDEAEVKAGFIYVGPIGDFGWSHAHDQGRLHVEEKFPWLDTIYVESVQEGDATRIIDRFVQEENSVNYERQLCS